MTSRQLGEFNQQKYSPMIFNGVRASSPGQGLTPVMTHEWMDLGAVRCGRRARPPCSFVPFDFDHGSSDCRLPTQTLDHCLSQCRAVVPVDQRGLSERTRRPNQPSGFVSPLLGGLNLMHRYCTCTFKLSAGRNAPIGSAVNP